MMNACKSQLESTKKVNAALEEEVSNANYYWAKNGFVLVSPRGMFL